MRLFGSVIKKPFVNCSSHGLAYETSLCRHLVLDHEQEWFFYEGISKDNPWPDAWCSLCQAEYLKKGKWYKEIWDRFDAIHLCDSCYEDARTRSVDYIKGDALEAWQGLLANCCKAFSEKQSALSALFGLGAATVWDMDQHTGQLFLSRDGEPQFAAAVQAVGSLGVYDNRWFWSWADRSIPDPASESILQVKDFGQENRFPRLTIPKWHAEEADGWDMTAIAAHLLNGKGAYRICQKDRIMFLLIRDIRRLPTERSSTRPLPREAFEPEDSHSRPRSSRDRARGTRPIISARASAESIASSRSRAPSARGPKRASI